MVVDPVIIHARELEAYTPFSILWHHHHVPSPHEKVLRKSLSSLEL
jgi:hypothetical protein